MSARIIQAEASDKQRRNAMIACIITMVAIGSTIPTAYEPFTRSNSWEAYANLLSGVIPTLAWLIGLVLVWRNRVEAGIQLGLITTLLAVPATSYWIEGVALANAVAVSVGATIIAGVCLRPGLARWYITEGILAALASLVIDSFAPHPRLITAPQDAMFLNIVVLISILALVAFLFMQFPRYSLRTKLVIVFVGLALLSTLAITVVATDAIRNTLTTNSARDLRTRAQSAGLSIGITMDRNVDRFQTMSLDKRLQDDAATATDAYPTGIAIREELIKRNAGEWATDDAKNPLISNALNGELAYSLRQFGDVFRGNRQLFMTDAYGSVIAATEWQPDYNFRDQEWWKIAYNFGSGSVFIGQPEFNPTINEHGILIAIPIYAPGRERVVGVLHGIYTLAALQRALLLNSFGQSGKIDLLFPQGQILTAENTFRPLTTTEFEEVKAGLTQPLATLNYRGTPLLSAQGVVGVSDEQPEPYLRSSAWRTIATIQEEEALGAVEAGAQAALIAGLVTIGVAVLAALILAQVLTRPIRRLTATAELVQGGDLTARAPVVTSDEIGTLALTFNNMTARLQDTLAGLERRVSERTQELSEANLSLQSNSAYLSALSDTSAGLFERLDLKDLLQTIVERAGALVGTQNGFVFFAEPGQDEIQMRVGSGLYDDLVGTRAQRGVGLAGSVWQTGEPMIIEDYQKWEGRLPGSRRDALRAIVAVPLKHGTGQPMSQEETIGVIGLAYTEAGRKYGKTEVEILQRFAQLAVIALDNAELYANSENRVQELAALNTISQLIAQPYGFKDVVSRIGDQIRTIFDSDFGYFAIFNSETNLIEFPYVVDEGKVIQIDPMPMTEGITAQVISSGQPILLSHATASDYERLGAVDSGDGASPHSLLAVPIRAGDTVLGALSVQRVAQDHPFGPNDQKLLTTIAASIGVGLQNVQLAGATQRQVAELSALNRIGAILTSDSALTERLAQVGRELHTIFGVSSVYVALYDAPGNIVRMPYFMGDNQEFDIEPFTPGPGFTSHIIKSRQPLVINDYMQAEMQALQAKNAGEENNTQSYLGVPIMLGDNLLGVVGLSDLPKNKFQDSDVRLLTTIAASVGTAIQNTRLLEQTQERARELDAVNSLAREITQQRSLDNLFQEVYLQVKSVSMADGLLVSLYDERTDSLTVPFLIDEGTRYEITPAALDYERAYVEQVRMGEALMINNTAEEAAELDKSAAVAGGGRASRSRLYVPLMAGVRFLGMISLHSYQLNAYTERDVSVLSGLASHIAVALENARLFEQTQNALAETDRLYRIAEAANTTTDETAFYERVQEIVNDAMPARNFFVALYNPDDNTMDMEYYVDEKDTLPEMPQRGLNVGTGITAYVLRTREPLMATRAEIHALAERGELQLHGAESEMWLGVPMVRGDRSIGVVAVQSYDPAVRYTERDKETLVKLSQGIANAIERIRAEAALRRSETQLGETMRLTRLGNWEYDVRDDMFTFNDQFYLMMRTSAAREGGYNMRSAHYSQRFVHPEDAGIVGAEIGKAIQATDPGFHGSLDHRVIFGDGAPGHVTVTFRITKNAEGKTVKTYGANLDITERKRAETDLQAALAETQRLALQARESAEQVNALNRRLTREGWGEYLNQAQSQLVAQAEGPNIGNGHNGESASMGGTPDDESANGYRTVRVPIQLRGQVIGEVELEYDELEHAWSQDQQAIVDNVTERLGIVLDNARLFQQSQSALASTQRLAAREKRASEIADRIYGATDVKAILRIATEELRKTTGSSRAVVKLTRDKTVS